MKEQLNQILSAALGEVRAASNQQALEAVRVRFLGKKGELTAILRGMGKLSAEERPAAGQLANQVRAQIEQALEQTQASLAEAAIARKLAKKSAWASATRCKPCCISSMISSSAWAFPSPKGRRLNMITIILKH